MNMAQPNHGQDPIETQAVVLRDEASRQLERLPLDEVHAQLEFIRQVMAKEMREGQDYGKIPGCGDKPGLFQPGAQKLLLTFQLTPHVKKEVLRELPHPTIFGHREYEFTLTLKSKAGREWDGVGTCSTLESKYRYRKSFRKCPKCGKETIFKSKDAPFGFYCWAKKGGCGAKFGPDDKAITSQEEGKADNDNPAEFWNTVRKMAFKRALVHGSINATNTSELWSQDLEDLPQAQSRSGSEYLPQERAEEPEGSFDAAQPAKVVSSPIPDTTKASPAPSVAAATPKHRMKALNLLQAAPGQRNRTLFKDYLMSKGWLTSDQEPEDGWSLANVPATKEAMTVMVEDVSKFEQLRREERAA